MIYGELGDSRTKRTVTGMARLLRALRLDGMLLSGLIAVTLFGLFVLWSAAGDNTSLWFSQVARIGIGFALLAVLSQVPDHFLRMLSPAAYVLGLVLLVVVALAGDIGKGAQRWLDLGVIRFQPSEIMKLAVPMMCAWYLHQRPLPPSLRDVGAVMLIILLPVALIAEQPDLGTALLVAASGLIVLVMGGLSLAYVLGGVAVLGAAVPVAWHFMHEYQRQRVLTLLDPQSDALGAGYHIIQSQIAIGSGGVFGKGWMNGSQAQLEFLPERSTDFIFAVIGEELGLLGLIALLVGYLFIVGRGHDHVAAVPRRILAPARGQHRAHVLRLRVRECRHGHGPAAGGRRAAAARQLRRHFVRDPDGRLRYPDVAAFQQKARGMRMKPATATLRAPWLALLLAAAALPARALDLEREDVRAFAGGDAEETRLRRGLARRGAGGRRPASRASSSS